MTAATLMQLVAGRAQDHPRAIALLAPDRPVLTYDALLQNVQRAVAAFAAAGLGRGSRIGVALPNGPELAVTLLAATDCAICAPLNPALDATTSRHLLERMRIDALVVPAGDDSPARRVASALGLPVIQLAVSPGAAAGTFALAAQGSGPAVPAGTPQPGDTSLLLHTSGTTGAPKIVPYSCRNLVESARLRAGLMHVTASDRCLLVAPLFTASGIRRNLFPVLGAGGSVVCTPGLDTGSFLDWLEQFQPTFYTGSPTLHRAVLDLLLRRNGAPRHSLRCVFSTSAPFPPGMQDRLEHAIGVPVIQAYSSTETGTVAQAALPPGERRAGSVGLPAGGEIAIMDAEGGFLPAGEIGEIVARGAEVFEGYEDDPEATRRAFCNGWCRTGDLGYLDRDGYLFLCGRIKELINRGGYKVSPAEIDEVLGRHPAVLEAAAVAVPHSTLGEDVVAAVVLRTPGSATPEQLRDFALAELAAFKVPSRVLLVAELPRTALGKIRRRELADALAHLPQHEFQDLAGPNEAMVARIFAEVLGLGAVGALDNFFELGGDSLRGAQVVNRVNAALGLGLPATTLFRRPTVRGFAAELAVGATSGEVPGPPPALRRAHARRPAPPTGTKA